MSARGDDQQDNRRYCACEGRGDQTSNGVVNATHFDVVKFGPIPTHTHRQSFKRAPLFQTSKMCHPDFKLGLLGSNSEGALTKSGRTCPLALNSGDLICVLTVISGSTRQTKTIDSLLLVSVTCHKSDLVSYSCPPGSRLNPKVRRCAIIALQPVISIFNSRCRS